jgi:hypothetical protein
MGDETKVCRNSAVELAPNHRKIQGAAAKTYHLPLHRGMGMIFHQVRLQAPL